MSNVNPNSPNLHDDEMAALGIQIVPGAPIQITGASLCLPFNPLAPGSPLLLDDKGLIAWICEHVMGWHPGDTQGPPPWPTSFKVEQAMLSGDMVLVGTESYPMLAVVRDGQTGHLSLFDPLTDLDAAAPLAAKIAEMGYETRISIRSDYRNTSRGEHLTLHGELRRNDKLIWSASLLWPIGSIECLHSESRLRSWVAAVAVWRDECLEKELEDEVETSRKLSADEKGKS